MQTNPLYENTVYDSIPESFALPPPPSYESHIYQELPEMVRRVPVESVSLPVERPHPTPYTVVCVEEEQEDEGKNETDNGGTVERESDYILMQSVTEPSSPLRTESIC